MTKNNKHEFKLVLTDVELTEEQQERVSRAVAQAGVMALGDLLPKESLTVPVRRGVWWYGIPRPDLMTELQGLATERERQ
ncbi:MULTISPECIES: hypothetical protein [Streptomyces]|uniref:Uncharacterized protein n=1 Tax=Streptomyces solicathayae TaxID=3081768 RepID=A0ABZ0LM55_9ACTN|nr:hypothetical protein [Streptomyces sp. HUAS YS2]WOX20521.1 hypothetical protein R2D22_03595 [Streptomyces sp. HUAS YS2]